MIQYNQGDLANPYHCKRHKGKTSSDSNGQARPATKTSIWPVCPVTLQQASWALLSCQPHTHKYTHVHKMKGCLHHNWWPQMTSSCHRSRNQEDLSLVSLWTGWHCSPIISSCRELSPSHLASSLSSSKQKSAQLAILLPGGCGPRTRSTPLPLQSSLPASHLVCHNFLGFQHRVMH